MASSRQSLEFPLKVLVIGKTGVGKSQLINKLCGQKVAESGSDCAGVTRENKRYRFNIIHQDVTRKAEVVDTSGIGDPTVSFEDAVAALVNPETTALGELFDVVLICEKNLTRCEPEVRKALQIIDVSTMNSDVPPWESIIFVGTFADKWDWEDDDGNELDPVSAFHSKFIPKLVEFARKDGAETCFLPNAVAVTARRHNVVKGMDSLCKMLVKWESALLTNKGVEFRPFDPAVLEKRYAKISGSQDMNMGANFRLIMSQQMAVQDMACIYRRVQSYYEAWTAQKTVLLDRVLPTNIESLAKLIANAEGEKGGVVTGKAVAASLATAAGIMVWFPPTTVPGLICGIASGVTAIGTTGADFKLGANRRGSLQEAMKQCLAELKRFQDLSEILHRAIQRYAEGLGRVSRCCDEFDVDPDIIAGFNQAVAGTAALSGHIGGAISYGVVASQVASETVETGAQVGARVSATAFGGALAVIGGAVAIADLAYTASQEPPHLSKLEDARTSLIQQLDQARVVAGALDAEMQKLKENHQKLPRNMTETGAPHPDIIYVEQ